MQATPDKGALATSERAPLVSVILIFFNEERFIREAIESVLAQTYESWELLLGDDGSTDLSTEIAREYAAKSPAKIRYVEHSQHANRGTSATRNLAFRHARGEFIAYIDADDVWLKHKLEDQVARLLREPGVDMLYATTKYWYSWTGLREDQERDTLWQPVSQETRFEAPQLLAKFLNHRIKMPCLGSCLFRRPIIERVGGWENDFRSLHDDQVFFAKICLAGTIIVSPTLVDLYRRHPNSTCAVAGQSAELFRSQLRFFDWLEAELNRQDFGDAECRAIVEQRRTQALDALSQAEP